MRVFIDTLATTVGGGVSYLQGLLGGLARVAPEDEFVVAVRGVVHDYSGVVAPNVRFVPYPATGRGLAARWLWEQSDLRREVRRHAADAVFMPHNYGSLCPGAPQIVCLQVPYAARRYAVDTRQRALWLARDAMLWATAARTAAFVAVSEDTKRTAAATFGLPLRHVTTIHHGVDPRFRPMDAARAREEVAASLALAQPYLLAVGDVYVHKNYGNLIRGFARAAPRLGGRILAIAGGLLDPVETARVRLAVERAGLSRQVRFLDRVGGDLLPALYSAADAFVFPSRHETFGLPPLEAMACGTPVAASSASCLPEVCGGAARYFAWDDPDSIAEALVAVSTDEALRARLRSVGPIHAAGFTWDRSARAHRAVFASVV